MSLIAQVEATLAALQLEESDSAAAELARTYAKQIDAAASIRAKSDKLVRDVIASGALPGETIYERANSLQAKLSERDCIDKMGRDLAALLDAIGGTPKSRAAFGKKTGHGGRQAPPGAGALHMMRGGLA